jgi:hypothetical protein
MTEFTLLIVILLFLIGWAIIVYYYDQKLVKTITEHEIRLEKKDILKKRSKKSST